MRISDTLALIGDFDEECQDALDRRLPRTGGPHEQGDRTLEVRALAASEERAHCFRNSRLVLVAGDHAKELIRVKFRIPAEIATAHIVTAHRYAQCDVHAATSRSVRRLRKV